MPKTIAQNAPRTVHVMNIINDSLAIMLGSLAAESKKRCQEKYQKIPTTKIPKMAPIRAPERATSSQLKTDVIICVSVYSGIWNLESGITP
jgi:hypothetical protein